MTSKNSFSSLMKEDMKSRMWLILVNNIILFLNFPIGIAMLAQEILERVKDSEYYKWNNAIEELSYYIGAGNKITLVLTICMAFLAAFSQFSYLYHKNQVDLYHSLPINRKRNFLVRYFNGVMVYVVPYLLFLLIGVVVVSASGFGQMVIIKEAILGFVIHLAGYVLCYSVGILAICLTGNIFTGLCGVITFSGYGILVTYFIMVMMEKFTSTCMVAYEKIGEMMYYFSPIGAYRKLSGLTLGRNYDSGVVSPKAIAIWLCGCIFAGILITFLSYIAYKKRPSESAGKSMAFSKSKGVIKVFLMTLITCLGSLMFTIMASAAETVWMIIGFGVSLVLSQILIQVIYEFDVKAISKGIVSMAVSASLGILIFAGFCVGGKFYDKYQINWDEFEYAAVAMESGLCGGYGSSFYEMEKGIYFSSEEYAFQNMKVEDKELIREFTQECIAGNQKNADELTPISMKYTLKNGKNVYRSYLISWDVVRKYLPRWIENQEFKEGFNYAFAQDLEKTDYFKYCKAWNGHETAYIDMKKENIAQLLEVYKEEYLAASFEELNENAPVLALIPCVDEKNDGGEWEICNIYVYPTFKKTLALLEEVGIKPMELPKDKVTEINITKWTSIGEQGQVRDISISYEEPEKIEELMKIIALQNYAYYTNFDGNIDDKKNYNIDILVEDEGNGAEEIYGSFIRDIPKWLEEDIKNATIEKEIQGTE